MIIENVLLLENLTDRVGRIYDRKEIEEQIDKTFMGELGIGISEKINLANVCCQIVNIKFIGDSLYGDVRFIETPQGKIAIEIVNSGTKYRMSIRSIGYVSDDMSNMRVTKLKITAFDFILEEWGHVTLLPNLHRI
jgi:hypothetical protein